MWLLIDAGIKFNYVRKKGPCYQQYTSNQSIWTADSEVVWDVS